jgi:hypothetical protein
MTLHIKSAVKVNAVSFRTHLIPVTLHYRLNKCEVQLNDDKTPSLIKAFVQFAEEVF